MFNRIVWIVFLTLPIYSCLYSRTTGPSFAVESRIKIISGEAVVRIDGKINENLYPYSSFQEKDEKYYDNPAIREGTITKNETKVLSAGEEYTVSVLPTEVVVLHILSSNGEDVEIAVYRYGREKKYFIGGSSKLGFSIAFQNN